MIVDRVASYGGQLHQFAVPKTLSRRSFLQVGAAAGGGLMLSLSLPFADSEAEAAEAGSFVPNAFIRIDSDGQIVLTMPYVEMGQGTYTSIPMLIAEELEGGAQSSDRRRLRPSPGERRRRARCRDRQTGRWSRQGGVAP